MGPETVAAESGPLLTSPLPVVPRSRPGPASSSPACTSSGVASILIPLSATMVSIFPAAAAATRGRLWASDSGSTLLCLQPSRAPTPLGESQTLPEAPKTLQDLPGPLPALPSYFSPPCSLCSTHRGPLTLSPTLQVQSCPRTFALALSATRMLFC